MKSTPEAVVFYSALPCSNRQLSAASVKGLSTIIVFRSMKLFGYYHNNSCVSTLNIVKYDEYTEPEKGRKQNDLTKDLDLELSADSMDAYVSLFGLNDRNIALIEQECNVSIALRRNHLVITGESKNIDIARQAVLHMLNLIKQNEPVDRVRIRYTIALLREGNKDLIEENLKRVIAVTHRGKEITCKTFGQRLYVDTIRDHVLTFAVGPAGTGKTYLAMALAVMALKNKEVERIILTRPAVEAGEKLGFLPGDLTQKVDPYLRPLYDAMYDLMGADSYTKLIERGIVEVAPLAYMRGRTLSDAFIILDEAQNTTSEQMKMFLTRMGFHSRVVVTGDITQTDLPSGKTSGLAEAVNLLQNIPGIGIVKMSGRDIVRHELVQQIVEAYDAADKKDNQLERKKHDK